MLCALIMAGGKGTRFWPLSTESKPKQFLNLIGDKTMIQMTVERIKTIISVERIFICTGSSYLNIVKEQLPEIPDKNIIIEPEGKNTAPCIMLSSMIIKRCYKDASVIVLPSDHLIRNEEEFRKILKDGFKFINVNREAIVTLGITPTRIETGYGYIKFNDNLDKDAEDSLIYKVDRFIEKPDFEKAKIYIEEGKYLWNSGMFIWKIDNIISKIKRYAPNIYEILKEIEYIDDNQLQQYVNENYIKAEAISIDYAVLEKSNDIYVIPSDIGWDDIGTWKALERYKEKDLMGNICIGDVHANESRNNLIIAVNDKIIINNIDDIYVVENEGNIIIGKKNLIASNRINMFE